MMYWAGVAPRRGVFVYGPVGLADAAVEGARMAGVLDNQIHQERFVCRSLVLHMR